MGDRSLASMSSGDHQASAAASPARALVLATISFALAFAAWGLVGGLASAFSGLYGLTASETAFLVAVPVLLGSLARLPMGILTDRFGGPPRLHGTARVLFARRFRRAADRQLPALCASVSIGMSSGPEVPLRR